jgi:hypothetical protein
VRFKVLREQVVCYADYHPRPRCLDREIHESCETRENDHMLFVLFASFRWFRGPNALRYESMGRCPRSCQAICPAGIGTWLGVDSKGSPPQASPCRANRLSAIHQQRQRKTLNHTRWNTKDTKGTKGTKGGAKGGDAKSHNPCLPAELCGKGCLAPTCLQRAAVL